MYSSEEKAALHAILLQQVDANGTVRLEIASISSI